MCNPKPTASIVYKYAFAGSLTILALVLSALFWSVVQEFPFLFFVGAVVLSAWRGGLGPGMLSAAIAIVTADYFLIEPLHTVFTRPGDLLQFGIFSFIALLVGWLEQSRNQSEQSLRELRDELEVILNSVVDGITAQDASGRPVFANVAAARLTGYPSPRAMLGKSPADLHRKYTMYDEQDNPVPYTALPRFRVFNTGKSASLTFKMRFEDTQEEKWVHLTSAPVFNERGSVKMTVNVLRDITQQIESERSLSRSEAIIYNSNDAIIGKSLDGIITSWNPGAEQLYGYTPEEAIGQHISLLIPEDIKSTELQLLDRLKDGARIQHYETRRIHKDGYHVDISLTISPINTDDGQIIGYSTIERDITQYNRLTRQLELEKRRLTTILNTIPGIVYEGSGDEDARTQRMEFVSSYIEEMLGYTREELRAAPNFWERVIHPDDWDPSIAHINESYTQGIPGPVPFRCITKGGDIRYAESYHAVITDALGKRYGTCGLVLDVTGRRQREQEIMQLTGIIDGQRRRLDAIIRNLPGIVFDMTYHAASGEQSINMVSDYVETMLGYPTDKWQDESGFWKQIIHPDDWELTVAEAAAAYENNRPGSVQFRCFHGNGEIVYAESFFNFITRESEARQVGVIMDITERKRIEADLESHTEDLRRSNEDLEQFAYIASHDLQEPLRMVTSYLQLIEQRYADALDDDAREFIYFAVDGASRMKVLINDLLAYSRVQRKPLEVTTVNMTGVLDRVTHNLQVPISETNATISADRLPEITANEGQMVQLLQDLIGNALKFHGDQPPQIHIGVQRLQHYWEFSVRDNGIGIDPEYMDRIFFIFQRLHTRQAYPGTGIGLAICRRIVEKHGGKIWAESQSNKGTTFYFTIPAERRKRHNVYGSD